MRPWRRRRVLRERAERSRRTRRWRSSRRGSGRPLAPSSPAGLSAPSSCPLPAPSSAAALISSKRREQRRRRCRTWQPVGSVRGGDAVCAAIAKGCGPRRKRQRRRRRRSAAGPGVARAAPAAAHSGVPPAARPALCPLRPGSARAGAPLELAPHADDPAATAAAIGRRRSGACCRRPRARRRTRTITRTTRAVPSSPGTVRRTRQTDLSAPSLLRLRLGRRLGLGPRARLSRPRGRSAGGGRRTFPTSSRPAHHRGRPRTTF